LNKIAIAVLTKIPSNELIEFYKKTIDENHELFIVVDDNQHKISEHDGINFIYLDDSICIHQGFTLFNTAIKKNGIFSNCSAWEKALMFFCELNKTYDHVWFIEDDVFIPQSGLISEIDQQHPHSDLITNRHNINNDGSLGAWKWWQTFPREILPPPWAHSMVCAVRLSKKLLQVLSEFVKDHKNSMKFIEYIFNTLALHNNLEIRTINNLSGIRGPRLPWTTFKLMRPHIFYHPVKSIDDQIKFRKELEELP
jgi:hypothetical protein